MKSDGEGDRCGHCGSDGVVLIGVSHAPPGALVQCRACGHGSLKAIETQAQTVVPCPRCGSARTVSAGTLHTPPAALVCCRACGYAYMDATDMTAHTPARCSKCGSSRMRGVGPLDASGAAAYVRCDECEFLAVVRRTML